MKFTFGVQVLVAFVIASAITAGMYLANPANTATCHPTRDVFLVKQERQPETGVEKVTLLKFHPNTDKGDSELGTIQGYFANAYSHDREGRIFLFSGGGSRHSL